MADAPRLGRGDRKVMEVQVLFRPLVGFLYIPAIAFILLVNFIVRQSSFIASPFPPPTPTPDLSPTPTPTETPSLNHPPISPTPTPRYVYISSANNEPWGVATQIGEHTWSIRVQNDSSMGSPDEIIKALNDLRARYGAQPLKTDSHLCTYAQERAKYFDSIKSTDAHKGFMDFLNHQDGFTKLGYGYVGENSSYGYIMSGVHLIEFVYNSDPDHSKNQLDPKWDHGCVGTFGAATELIFATSPL
jgi:uncharacterized protein YkwD